MQQELYKKYKHDIYLWGSGKAQRAYLFFGCHYDEEKNAYRFVTWAPNAHGVSVVGDFNAWDPLAAPMIRLPGGIFVAFVKNARSGDRYKYCIKKGGQVFLKSDPFAFWSETGQKNASRVWSIEAYPWGDGAYLQKRKTADPLKSPMNIYEVHPGSWKEGTATFRTLAQPLADYCAEMGYTHVELTPVTEYPFPESWGYQVTGYFAPTARYGTPEDFMYFVDIMHQKGIGVIMDWVPAHFPRDAHGLAKYDGTCLYEYADPRLGEHAHWGTLVFDYGKGQVQSFLISSAMFFLDLYHVDGLRVDAVSSMLYRDYGRSEGNFLPNKYGGKINLEAVDFLQNLNAALFKNHPHCLTFAEESTAFPCVTKPPSSGGLGFLFKWDMGFMHDTLEYMSMDHYFRQFNHNKLTFSMMYAFSENFVLAYSHDEVVHGKRSMVDKMFGTYDQKFSSLRALYGYFFAHPGKKLTFMGSEIGQFAEWNHRSFVEWELLSYPRHLEMQRYCKSLGIIYKNHPALFENDTDWRGFRWLSVNNNSQSVIAFMRISEGGERIVCVCNFTPNAAQNVTVGLPRRGRLKLMLNSDNFRFGGSGCKVKKRVHSRNRSFEGHPLSARLDLPPLSTLYYRFESEEEYI